MPPSFEYELKLGLPQKLIAGVDEVGRGALAGDIVAAAVILPRDIIAGIDDSKKLSEKKRVALTEEIKAKAIFALGAASAKEIDKLGLSRANDLAMTRAVHHLPQKPAALLIDGTKVPAELNETFHALAVIRGDSLSLSIAAASIIAKTARDKKMRALATSFPRYGWQSNVGYGTRAHLEALERWGPTKHHRFSFAPLKSSR